MATIFEDISQNYVDYRKLLWYLFVSQNGSQGGRVMSDFFLNDKCKVLKCMAERQIPVNGEMVIKLSQQEIADILKFTKPKVNSIVRSLKDAGYLIQHGARGKYSLTAKAVEELRIIDKMEATK